MQNSVGYVKNPSYIRAKQRSQNTFVPKQYYNSMSLDEAL